MRKTSKEYYRDWYQRNLTHARKMKAENMRRYRAEDAQQKCDELNAATPPIKENE